MEEEEAVELADSEAEQRRRQGEGEEQQQEEEQVVHCAVGKEAGREWKANLQWVLANLMNLPSTNKRLVFLHIHRPASRINMMGAWVPVSQLAEQEVTAYRQLEEGKIGKELDDLLDICKSQKVNASKIIIASDDTASGLVQFVDDHGITKLVMGAASDRAYHRKMRAPRSKKALTVQRRANPSCKIWFVCRGNLICTREASKGSHHRAESSATASTSPRSSVSDCTRSKSSPRVPNNETLFSARESNEQTTSPLVDQAPARDQDDYDAMDRRHQSADDIAGSSSKPSMSETVMMLREVEDDQQEDIRPSPDGSDYDGDMDDALYEKLKDAIMEAENLKQEAYEETRRRQMAERDLAEANKMADEAERSYHREAKQRKEVEQMLARERAEMERDRQALNGMLEQTQKVNDRSAELEHQIASSERMMRDLEARLSESYSILDSLRQHPTDVETDEESQAANDGDHRPLSFRRFSYSELDEATDHFDESVRIDGGGDGGRGKVYRGCGLMSSSNAAVKVVSPDVAVGEARFTREVEAISRVRHPGLVTLFGACPEARAVVYELVPGGSLEERLATLPWHARCGVAYRTCSALSFLHSTRTVHGDVRPANILLPSSSSCKLSGLGTRRLVRRGGHLALAYADPHYLATGELTPRCDVYSLGVVLLRLVTGMSAFLARKAAQEAASGSKAWHEVVDRGWPVERAREVALLGLRCCDTTKRYPLGSSSEHLLEEVRRVLEDAATSSIAAPGRRSWSDGGEEGAPSYFMCPILKEVMRDPRIAGDGFSYEAEAIKEWLDSGHDTSPMTNLKLPTRELLPNHALRSAIHEWRQRQGQLVSSSRIQFFASS